MATTPATRQHGRPLKRTSCPGVYRRGSRWVAIYRIDGRQRKRTAATFAAAREIKRAADANQVEQALGPTLHAYALEWVQEHLGSGYDTVREFTRSEYRRLLETYTLEYFDSGLRLGDLDRQRLGGFVSWLIHQPGRDGRLTDRSIANILTPLRLCLETAVAEGHLEDDALLGLKRPRRRGGGAWHRRPESRFLTRDELRRVLAEIPPEWKPLIELLASTGLRISEAIALRWSDLDLDRPIPRLQVRQSIVRGVVGRPKSRHGVRTLPLTTEIAKALADSRAPRSSPDALVFARADGQWLRPEYVRRAVLDPAAKRSGVRSFGVHALRHTCASLLIAKGASALQLQRWMGHHSAAYTLETYGHLIDGGLGPALELTDELIERT